MEFDFPVISTLSEENSISGCGKMGKVKMKIEPENVEWREIWRRMRIKRKHQMEKQNEIYVEIMCFIFIYVI